MEGKILSVLDRHKKRFDGIDLVLDQHAKKLDQHTKTLDQHTEQLDFLARASIKHESDIKYLRENMVTKQDHQEVMSTLDKIVGMFKEERDETTSVSHGMRRMDDRIEKNTRDVTQIKPLVGLTN